MAAARPHVTGLAFEMAGQGANHDGPDRDRRVPGRRRRLARWRAFADGLRPASGAGPRRDAGRRRRWPLHHVAGIEPPEGTWEQSVTTAMPPTLTPAPPASGEGEAEGGVREAACGGGVAA